MSDHTPYTRSADSGHLRSVNPKPRGSGSPSKPLGSVRFGGSMLVQVAVALVLLMLKLVSSVLQVQGPGSALLEMFVRRGVKVASSS